MLAELLNGHAVLFHYSLQEIHASVGARSQTAYRIFRQTRKVNIVTPVRMNPCQSQQIQNIEQFYMKVLLQSLSHDA